MSNSIKIQNCEISDTSPVFIIAEIGVNHNGDLNLAKKIIDVAVDANAQAVKIQNYVTEELIRRDAPKASYQDANIGTEKSQYQMLKELELNEEQTRELKHYCDQKSIIFLSTPYDMKSIQLLEKLGVPAFKLASIDVVTHPLIESIACLRKPLILSTGMATEQEIKEASDIFAEATGGSRDQLILMQCNTNYPSPIEEQNLRALSILKKYALIVGFSDHTVSDLASTVAVGLGARVIERHITLDKNLPGPDHSASLNPEEFTAFVRSIRNAELALGKSEKITTKGEEKNILAMRRSICAAGSLTAGMLIKFSDITYKRPGTGLKPTAENIKLLIGTKLIRGISADENITLADVE